MNEQRAPYLPTLVYAVIMWAAVIGVLIYNHTLLVSQHVPPAVRSQKELPLYIIAACFLLFNGVMTALRLKQIARTKQTRDRISALTADRSASQQTEL